MAKRKTLFTLIILANVFYSCTTPKTKLEVDNNSEKISSYNKQADTLRMFCNFNNRLRLCVHDNPIIYNNYLKNVKRIIARNNPIGLTNEYNLPKISNGTMYYEDNFLRIEVRLNCDINTNNNNSLTDSVSYALNYLTTYQSGIDYYVNQINSDITNFFEIECLNISNEKNLELKQGDFKGLRRVVLGNRKEVLKHFSDLLYIEYGDNLDTVMFDKWYKTLEAGYQRLDMGSIKIFIEKSDRIKRIEKTINRNSKKARKPILPTKLPYDMVPPRSSINP